MCENDCVWWRGVRSVGVSVGASVGVCMCVCGCVGVVVGMGVGVGVHGARERTLASYNIIQ